MEEDELVLLRAELEEDVIDELDKDEVLPELPELPELSEDNELDSELDVVRASEVKLDELDDVFNSVDEDWDDKDEWLDDGELVL